MFKKKKDAFSPVTMRTHIRYGGCEETGTITVDTYEGFFKVMKDNFLHKGALQVTFQGENYVHISTPETANSNLIEERIDEVRNLLENHFKGKAFAMKAYAVFESGVLKGVFPEYIQATLKKKKLMNKGILMEAIEIKEIDIGSFEDFS